MPACPRPNCFSRNSTDSGDDPKAGQVVTISPCAGGGAVSEPLEANFISSRRVAGCPLGRSYQVRHPRLRREDHRRRLSGPGHPRAAFIKTDFMAMRSFVSIQRLKGRRSTQNGTTGWLPFQASSVSWRPNIGRIGPLAACPDVVMSDSMHRRRSGYVVP